MDPHHMNHHTPTEVTPGGGTSSNGSQTSQGSNSATPSVIPGLSSSSSVPPPSVVVGATQPPLTSPAPATKIVSRNVNGTLVVTSAPGNEAELQLYRVMQRASLLAYYDTLLEMGGDDVQQLCDAGEEEFLEIMALVGMASKPLHVRRLQKALQEWVSNPALFQTPLLSTLPGSGTIGFPSSVRPINLSPQPLPIVAPMGPSPPSNNNHGSPCGSNKEGPTSLCVASPGQGQSALLVASGDYSASGPTPSPGRGPSTSTSPGPCCPGSPLQLTPVLVETQIARLAEAADHLVRSLPQFEPKPHNTKKKICKDLEMVMSMSEDDPRRMDEIRKYAAIYGRFDCKRKPEKPLTLHEVSVNEAAAQICRFMPALLTRRDELFPLARQVVRDSGYHYSKGHSNLSTCFRTHSGTGRSSCNNGEDGGCKRPRLEGVPPSLSPSSCDFLDVDPQQRLRRQERLEQIADELRSLGERMEELVSAAQQVRDLNDYPALHTLQQQLELLQGKQTQLLVEQSDLMKQQPHSSARYYRRGRVSSCFDSERPDTDDTDSQFSFSNTSSPSQEVGDSRDSTATRDGVSEGNGTLDIKGRSPCKISKQVCGQFDVRCGLQRLVLQLVQDTLLDEGLRVVKELVANQNKDSSTGSDNSYCDSYNNENKVQVIASSGGNIIAVANPALSMSPAIVPPTPVVSDTGSGTDKRSSTPVLVLKQEPPSPAMSPSPTIRLAKSE
ncbi:NGFI-A-binding protein homolog isoform X2 [Zootermopsis nevadensis]|uniref:NGFI-A-binding protein homolog isoform X2 n=1 Tax=Zootermopsis nevadensis TaxID=136037 RepID=UPI000B8E76E1|nr:NGFI-A-binding protein homolog isoform X2 [Zootermopsis nevadensis]